MLHLYRSATGAALLGLALSPVAAMAEDASASPPPTLVSALSLTPATQPADSGKLGVNVASLPSDAMVPPPPLPTDRGFYISADGSGQSMSLPPVNLGFVNTTGFSPPPFLYNGATVTHNPQATGAGVDLAFGYYLPPTLVAPTWGSAPRVELDFSLLNANEQQTSFLTPNGGPPLDPLGGNTVAGLMLNGVAINSAPFCNLPALNGCQVNSSESTDYQTWHLAAKVASDFPLGGLVTATPSLSVIGGEGNNDVGVSQLFSQTFLGAPNNITQSYSARVKLNWSDIGGKAGLTLKAPLSSWVTASISGSVALLDRETSLRGSDIYTGTLLGVVPLPIPPQTSPMFSAISSSKSTTAVLSNFESSVEFQLWPSTSLRIFGGLNYDDSVPGVRAPVFFGSEIASPGGVPARIKFVGETALYGGAGFVVHF